MTSIKIFIQVVGTIACAVGGIIAFIFLFPSYAMEFGMTDDSLKSLFIIFVMWMFLFAVSMHVHAQETRKR